MGEAAMAPKIGAGEQQKARSVAVGWLVPGQRWYNDHADRRDHRDGDAPRSDHSRLPSPVARRRSDAATRRYHNPALVAESRQTRIARRPKTHSLHEFS